jgi:peptidoglycan/LPS O-acetylase OafA/YrhL
MYVLHMLPVARALVDGDVAASFERVAGPQLGGIAFLLCAGVATYGAARVTWMVLERPCLDLKRFFAYEPVRATVR